MKNPTQAVIEQLEKVHFTDRLNKLLEGARLDETTRQELAEILGLLVGTSYAEGLRTAMEVSAAAFKQLLTPPTRSRLPLAARKHLVTYRRRLWRALAAERAAHKKLRGIILGSPALEHVQHYVLRTERKRKQKVGKWAKRWTKR